MGKGLAPVPQYMLVIYSETGENIYRGFNTKKAACKAYKLDSKNSEVYSVLTGQLRKRRESSTRSLRKLREQYEDGSTNEPGRLESSETSEHTEDPGDSSSPELG